MQHVLAVIQKLSESLFFFSLELRFFSVLSINALYTVGTFSVKPINFNKAKNNNKKIFQILLLFHFFYTFKENTLFGYTRFHLIATLSLIHSGFFFPLSSFLYIFLISFIFGYSVLKATVDILSLSHCRYEYMNVNQYHVTVDDIVWCTVALGL